MGFCNGTKSGIGINCGRFYFSVRNLKFKLIIKKSSLKVTLFGEINFCKIWKTFEFLIEVRIYGIVQKKQLRITEIFQNRQRDHFHEENKKRVRIKSGTAKVAVLDSTEFLRKSGINSYIVFLSYFHSATKSGSIIRFLLKCFWV